MNVDDVNRALFTNLQLLGMDVLDMEGKYKIPFDKDMFNLPNKAGSEAVLHFLFNKLNPSLCREQFRDCWPVMDKKTELQFRKVCNNWLSCIQKDEADAHMPRMNASLLLSPGGRKFILMLFSFSSYVLKHVMMCEHGCKQHDILIYPTQTASTVPVSDITLSALQDSIVRDREDLFEQLHLVGAAIRKWKEYSEEQVKEYRTVCKRFKDLQHDKRQQINVTAESAIKQGCTLPAKRTLHMFDSERDDYAIKRGQRIEQARSQWRTLTAFDDSSKGKRAIVQSILDETLAKNVLDGTDMGIRVPGLLLRECKKEIHEREIDNVYIGGRLNLVSVLQLWNICLKLYYEQIVSENLPEVSSEISQLMKQVHKHHSYFMRTQQMKEEMANETIPALRRSIKNLRKTLKNQHNLNCSGKDGGEPGLGLTTNTPVGPLMTMSSRAEESTPFKPLILPESEIDTPDAVSSMAAQIESMSQKSARIQPSHLLQDATALTRIQSSHRKIKEKGSAMKMQRKQVPRVVKRTREVKGIEQSITSDTGAEKLSTSDPPLPGALSARLFGTNEKPSSQQKLPTEVFKSSKISGSTSVALETPRSSKQKVVDKLADHIVDSVMVQGEGDADLPLSDCFTDRTNVNQSNSNYNDLDEDAFAPKDLIKRSPMEPTPQIKTAVQRHSVLGGARSKTLSDQTRCKRENKSHSADITSIPALSLQDEVANIQNAGSFAHNLIAQQDWSSPSGHNSSLCMTPAAANTRGMAVVRGKSAEEDGSCRSSQPKSSKGSNTDSPSFLMDRTPQIKKSSFINGTNVSASSVLDTSKSRDFMNAADDLFSGYGPISNMQSSPNIDQHTGNGIQPLPLSNSNIIVSTELERSQHGAPMLCETGVMNNIGSSSTSLPGLHLQHLKETLHYRQPTVFDSDDTDDDDKSNGRSRSESPSDMFDRPPGDGEASAEPSKIPVGHVVLDNSNVDDLINVNTSLGHVVLDNSNVGALDIDTLAQLSLLSSQDISFSSLAAGATPEDHTMGNTESKTTSFPYPLSPNDHSSPRDYCFKERSSNRVHQVYSPKELSDCDTTEFSQLVNLDDSLEAPNNDSFAPLKQGIQLDGKSPLSKKTLPLSASVVHSSPKHIKHSAFAQSNAPDSHLQAKLPQVSIKEESLAEPDNFKSQTKLALLQQKALKMLNDSDDSISE